MHGLTGGDFVWKKRRGGLGEIRDEESIERRRAELLEIQERRRRQDDLRQSRLLAREMAHSQESESHAHELEFQSRVFEFQTLRMKGNAIAQEHTFRALVFNLYRAHACEIYDLSAPVTWTPATHLVFLLHDCSMEELTDQVEVANLFLENLLQIVELRQKSEKFSNLELEKNIIDDKTMELSRPGGVKQLELEIEFWIKLKTALIGEMRERLDKEQSLASLTVTELRHLITQMNQTDVWDIGRLISLHLHYAVDDDRVDVDFWESLESRFAWISAVVWLNDLSRKINSDNSAAVSTLEHRVPEVVKSDANETKRATFQLVEAELSNNNMVIPKFSVDIEDPNDVFDRIVLRETAQEAADCQNIIKGGDYESWLGGIGRNPTQKALVKPRYFNRIKVAHEWHKYNQVHYDIDNPPPKSVQGYKFTLCYPNLAQHLKPNWKLIEDKDSEDTSTVLIKFSAPTYEDVAFRIIRREWDLTPRNGYKNIYEGGIFILSFMLKRNRYRK